MRARSTGSGLVIVAVLIAAVLVAILQVALAPWMQIKGAVPDLLVATTVALALHFGSWPGFFWGLVVGGMADVLAAHPVGILAISLAVVGYGAGLGHRLVLESKLVAPIGVGLVASLCNVLLQAPLAMVWGYPVLLSVILRERALPDAIYTAFWGWAFFLLLLTGHRLRGRERLAL